MEAINWLDGHAGTVTAIATAVLVVITGFYAWVTKKMLAENRLMRLDAQKPEIAIFLRPHESMINFTVLCVQNIGGGPAKDVRFACSSDALLLESTGYAKHGISYFGPGQKIEDVIMSEDRQPVESVQTPVEITVTYKDSVNNEYKGTFSLNFQLYQGVLQFNDPLFSIHGTLQSIEKSLCSISQQLQKDYK